MAQTKRKKKRARVSASTPKRGMEFSKKIILAAGLVFIVSLIDIRAAVRNGLDVSGYATQQILTTGGILGASIIFYLNKSKYENLSKGKIRFTLLKLRLELKLKDQIPEESYQLVLDEINKIDSMLDSKLDGALEEAIQQEVELQNY